MRITYLVSEGGYLFNHISLKDLVHNNYKKYDYPILSIDISLGALDKDGNPIYENDLLVQEDGTELIARLYPDGFFYLGKSHNTSKIAHSIIPTWHPVNPYQYYKFGGDNS